MKRGAPLGNRHAAGPRRRPAESAALSQLITLLYDVTGLSYAEIAHRLEQDFGLTMSRVAVWQRYKREKKL